MHEDDNAPEVEWTEHGRADFRRRRRGRNWAVLAALVAFVVVVYVVALIRMGSG